MNRKVDLPNLRLPAPLIGLVGASETVRRQLHFQRARRRRREKHPIVEVTATFRDLSPEELRK